MTTAFAISQGRDPSASVFYDLLDLTRVPRMVERRSEEGVRGVPTRPEAEPSDRRPADIEDLTIPAGPEGAVSIRVVRPKGDTSLLPTVMYFHGSGRVPGGSDTHDRFVREIAHGARAAVVFVNFTSTREAMYPLALEEACAATLYIAEHGKRHNLDGSCLAVAGDGGGGSIAATVTFLARALNRPKLAYQVLFYPVTDPDCSAFCRGHFLARGTPERFAGSPLTQVSTRAQITASPLRASIDQLAGLPPALVITCEFDVLRDEGEAYAAKLSKAGVSVTALRYFGLCHDFVVIEEVSKSDQALSAIGLASTNLRAVFDRQRGGQL